MTHLQKIVKQGLKSNSLTINQDKTKLSNSAKRQQKTV